MQVMTARRARYPHRNYGYVIKYDEPIVTVSDSMDIEGVGLHRILPTRHKQWFHAWYRHKSDAERALMELKIEKNCASLKPITRMQLMAARIRANRLADPNSLFWKGSRQASRDFAADVIRSDRELMGNKVCRDCYRRRA